MHKKIILGVLAVTIICFLVWVNVRLSPKNDVTKTEENSKSIETQFEKEPGATAIDTAPEQKENTTHSLVLAHTKLTKVPNDIFTRTDLLTLDLSNNNLTGALPGEVRHLTSLRSLNLSYNEFTGVPAEVGQLKDLEYLNLAHNELTGLPYELGNLSHLRELILTGNNYSKTDLEIIKKSLPASTKIITE